MSRTRWITTILAGSLFLVGCQEESITSDDSDYSSVVLSKGGAQMSAIHTFQAAGSLGGGVLTPGTTFPAGPGAHSALRRGSDWLKVNLNTNGLPPGAYTMWWVIFNYPDECVDPVAALGASCGEGDFFSVPAGMTAYLADGGIVPKSGSGNFSSKTRIGDDLGAPGKQFLFGPGLLNPSGAETHLIVKYHGPASEDPAVLAMQTSTLLGSCDAGANGVNVIHCFDPQAAVHPAP